MSTDYLNKQHLLNLIKRPLFLTFFILYWMTNC